MPFFYDSQHYWAIAHTLNAWGFEATVGGHPGEQQRSVVVRLNDGRTVVWGNDHQWWRFTLVGATGSPITTGKAHLGTMAAPEQVAEFIASVPVPL